MKTLLNTIWRTLYRKGLAGILLGLGIMKYTQLSELPLFELVYAALLLASTITLAPVVRLMMFPTAAEIAEGTIHGGVKGLIKEKGIPSALIHYWLCTCLSYCVSLACVLAII